MDIAVLLADSGVKDTKVSAWLHKQHITEVRLFARCAPTEELLWKTVIDPMKLGANKLAVGAMVVDTWERARFQEGITSARGTELGQANQEGITSAWGTELGRANQDRASMLPMLSTLSRLRPTASMELAHASSSFRRGACLDAQTKEWVTDAEFWINCVVNHQDNSESQRNARDGADVDAEFAVRKLCDLTSERVEALFNRFDVDSDGFVGCKELAQVLKIQGLYFSEDRAAEVMQRVTGLGSSQPKQRFDINQFDLMLRCLQLAGLFSPSTCLHRSSSAYGDDGQSSLYCYDYTLEDCRPPLGIKASWEEPMVRIPGNKIKEFFFKEREAFNNVMPNRWVHMDAQERPDHLTIMRLAVKYHLHPLAVWYLFEEEPTASKMDRFQDNFVLHVEIVRAVKQDSNRDGVSNNVGVSSNAGMSNNVARQATQTRIRMPPRVQIIRSNAAIFLAKRRSEEGFDTLVTVVRQSRHGSSWLGNWNEEANESDGGIVRREPVHDIWEDLARELAHKPPRRVREEPADYLMYELLQRTTGEWRFIVDAYAKRLGFMHRRVLERKVPQEWLRELTDVRLELADLARAARPLRQVVRGLAEEAEMRPLIKAHLRNVEGSVEAAIEDLLQLSNMAQSIQLAHERHMEKRMSDTMFTLSSVGAIFMPAQFITGIYGMNFQNPDTGGPGLPELSWKYGYVFFWVLEAIAVSIAFFSINESSVVWPSWCNSPRLWERCKWRRQTSSYDDGHELVGYSAMSNNGSRYGAR